MVYAGYPLALTLLGRLRPGPDIVALLGVAQSVIVAAHDEVDVIADKVANVLASDYPALELIVASDIGDGIVAAARQAARPWYSTCRVRRALRAQPGGAGGVRRSSCSRTPTRWSSRGRCAVCSELRGRAGRRCGSQRGPRRL